MSRDENTGTPPRGRRRSRDWSARQEAFGRREAELLHELAEMREKISSVESEFIQRRKELDEARAGLDEDAARLKDINSD